MAFRGVFGGEGERVCPPLLFSDRVDGGVTSPKTAQKIYANRGWWCYAGGFILYLYLDRAKIFLGNQRVSGLLGAIWVLYIMPIALLRLPNNGKMAAKTIRQNAQWRKGGLKGGRSGKGKLNLPS